MKSSRRRSVCLRWNLLASCMFPCSGTWGNQVDDGNAEHHARLHGGACVSPWGKRVASPERIYSADLNICASLLTTERPELTCDEGSLNIAPCSPRLQDRALKNGRQHNTLQPLHVAVSNSLTLNVSRASHLYLW